jgi:predicted MFS family arabinose efflux permease
VLIGFNLGYLSAGPLAAWLIDRFGWRVAYAVLGGGCGLLTMLAALTVRQPRARELDQLEAQVASRAAGDAPDRRGVTAPVGGARDATLREALADPRHWYLNFAWLLMGATWLMLAVHIVPFARDQGISLAGASLALTSYGIGAVIGRLIAGVASDSLGTLATIRAGYALQALALIALLWSPSRGVLLLSLAAFGLGFAASDTMITKVIPEVFGVRALGAIMGVLALGWRLGAALGPAVAGFLYDLTGSYAIPFGAAPVAVLVSWGLFTLGSGRRRVLAPRRESV